MAFFMLAVLMVARLGPLCETLAIAAPPTVSVMIDCAGKPADAPAKKAPQSCAMPCAAVAGENAGHIEPLSFAGLSPWAIAQSALPGLASVPATPPPQIV